MKCSAIRARIRQLCYLGVPGELLMASLLPALRELLPSASGLFFWVDGCGGVRNLYAERLPFAELNSAAEWSAWFVACTESRDQIAAFDRRAQGQDHILCGIVRDSGAALGMLRLHRRCSAPPFSEDDRHNLASVMHYLARALAPGNNLRSRDAVTFAYEDTDEEALLVTDPFGTIHFASEDGVRLLLLATAPQITPTVLKATVMDCAMRAIKAVCARLEVATHGLQAPASITLDSPWGRFVLRGYNLNAGAGGKGRIGIRIQRRLPMILRFVDALGRQDLSPQQREIALQIALGLSNCEISERLGVSLNTVAYHLKQVFLRLDVHTRTEAIEKIAWGALSSRRGSNAQVANAQPA